MSPTQHLKAETQASTPGCKARTNYPNTSTILNSKRSLNLAVSSHLNGQGEWPSLAASIAGKPDNVLVSSGLFCHMEQSRQFAAVEYEMSMIKITKLEIVGALTKPVASLL